MKQGRKPPNDGVRSAATGRERPLIDRRGFLTIAGGQLLAFAAAGCGAGGRTEWSAGTDAAAKWPRMRFVVDDPGFVYSRPCFSPGGETIMFMRTPLTGDPATIENSNNADWGLWTVPADGGPVAPFFYDPQLHATRPDWSWATGRVAFTGIRNGRAQLWLLDGDGTNLTDVPVGDPTERQLHYPSWYPDGRAIALTDYRAHQVLRVDLVNHTFEPLTDPREVWAGMCSVSPDTGAGSPLAFAGQRPSKRYRANENVIWIQSAGTLMPLDGFHGRMPAWSPDGTRLAWVSGARRRPAPTFTLHPRSLPAAGKSAVYVTRTPTELGRQSDATAVTPFDHQVVHAKWSPDGTRLVCAAAAAEGDHRGIAVIELAG